MENDGINVIQNLQGPQADGERDRGTFWDRGLCQLMLSENIVRNHRVDKLYLRHNDTYTRVQGHAQPTSLFSLHDNSVLNYKTLSSTYLHDNFLGILMSDLGRYQRTGDIHQVAPRIIFDKNISPSDLRDCQEFCRKPSHGYDALAIHLLTVDDLSDLLMLMLKIKESVSPTSGHFRSLMRLGFMLINLITQSQQRKLINSGLHVCYMANEKESLIIFCLRSFPFYDRSKMTIDIKDLENKVFRARKYSMLFGENSDRQNVVVLTKGQNSEQNLPKLRECVFQGRAVLSADGSYHIDFRFMRIAEGECVEGWEWIFGICHMLAIRIKTNHLEESSFFKPMLFTAPGCVAIIMHECLNDGSTPVDPDNIEFTIGDNNGTKFCQVYKAESLDSWPLFPGDNTTGSIMNPDAFLMNISDDEETNPGTSYYRHIIKA